MATVYIAQGTNLGERTKNLAAAQALMPPDIRVDQKSPIYQTAPWGFAEQPMFLNQVLSAETDLSATHLLERLQAIEKQVGRRPTFRYGPRLIDLDLLFYDQLLIKQPGLELPHPRLQERAFVLRPLADIAPGLVHPRLQRSVRELLAALPPGELEGLELWPPQGPAGQ